MGIAARFAALTLPLLAAACGDPVAIVGDWPGTLRVVAGVPDSAGATLDSLATRTRLQSPRGLAVDAEGVLYVADRDAGRVLAIQSDGRPRVVASRTSCVDALCLQAPEALAVDAGGDLLIADMLAHVVWRVDPGTRRIERVAGTGTAGTSPDATPAAQAMLSSPSGLAVAADGGVYVSQRFASRVDVIGTDGVLRRVAGGNGRGFAGDGGAALAAQLADPVGLALHGDSLYIADSGNHRVRVVNLATGVIATLAGTGIPQFGGDDGAARAASLNRPWSLAVDPDGRLLYVADSQNHRVRSIDLETGLIDTFAGTGSTRYNGGGSAGATALSDPTGVATSSFGFVFIADTGHHIVWRGPIGY